ncbi:MAG: bifunctional response regulator/alkaline phosphatase family protein [Gemmatimonadetes bacterium]|uniref:Bifunctional response regulator/alkaline phosphatase family protein n=1 Tax=Candidatus Kutchimonas denitrificans TaxID=3056748 RepID=A0AAE5CAK8_9BACT|nr:bifunctional response regulator/alkaline phosphatase family protein [Gemmatimonadota bacterium]NIR74702.1 bifunctional response regulator/alkaline phosphatase family protein [Candidatus Kutchimonas denitrificans]NIS01452.1 bifunctional response regulator/alkaline phosphatase family protein [Gemmatimonadota bacterium]NIT67193.1 bifunctional response regulator/alkaline phosphatase family protein [Gemmatimonadota bacterium]NIU52367.1 response regulator [Gemmatimonadota bacterium]
MEDRKSPKGRILWVDDEIDLLLPHRLVLEQRGYDVDTTPNGDDALSQIRRQSYDLILLDQEMPGRTGTDMLREIRIADSRIPVVMVTKSEEESTLQQAIARRADDYIVKPTSPRQVASAVARLLEGPSLRHEQIAQDFVRSYSEIRSRIDSARGWRDWTDVYSELVDWELELSSAEERGLLESLHTLMGDARREFADFVIANYSDWVARGQSDRPSLSVDIVPQFFMPLLAHQEPAALIVVDCLRLDQWRALEAVIAEDFETESDLYFSILPTATPYARNAIFGGIFPDELAERRPGWPDGYEEAGLNSFEDELFGEQVARLSNGSVAIHYEKVHTASDSESMLRRLPSVLDEPRALGLVFNFVDLLTHGRGESQILFEMARDAEALRRLTLAWYEGSALREVLKLMRTRGIRVLLTTDHGSVHCHRPTTVYAKRDASPSLRHKHGDDLRAENPATVLTVANGEAIRLPAGGLKMNYLIAREDYFFVYPTKLREYQSRYRDSFLHGGISPEEMILPVALLKPRG